MWNRLKDRYAVSNTATKVQLQSKLSRMSYRLDSMEDYVDSYEEIFNCLSAIESKVADDMQVAMLLASFGDEKTSTFGHVLASHQSRQEKLDWETTTSILLQEYDDQLQRTGSSRKLKSMAPGHALAASGSRNKFGRSKYRHKSGLEKRRFFGCNKVGHLMHNRPFKDKKKQKHVPSADNNSTDGDGGNARRAQLLIAQQVAVNHPAEVNSRQDVKRTCHSCLSDGHDYDNAPVYAEDLEYQMYSSHYDFDSDYGAVMKTLKGRRSDTFLLDSGASDHMVWTKEWPHEWKEIELRAIMLGDGERVFSTHRGTLVLQTFVGREQDLYERILVIHGVLYVLDLHTNLLSCSRLCEEGYTINIGRNRYNGMHEGFMRFMGRIVHGVYEVQARPRYPQQHSACTAVSQMKGKDEKDNSAVEQAGLKLWHERFGHANVETIKRLFRVGAVSGINFKLPKSGSGSCGSCMKGKQTRQRL